MPPKTNRERLLPPAKKPPAKKPPAKKTATSSKDWESVKSKYKDIMQLYVDALPADDSQVFDKNYPHKKEQVQLKAITSKLKAIRLKFRQAVESGRRSGHGRVVMIYYELCERVWGGSPATS